MKNNHTNETLKGKIKELPEGNIMHVPFTKEEEESHAVRTRKRLNSYGERAAALNG